MAVRKIDAREMVKDIMAGIDDAAIMKKYRLSARGLQDLLDKLVQAGLLDQSDVEERVPLFERTVEIVLRCKKCGKPNIGLTGECPNCRAMARKMTVDGRQSTESVPVLQQASEIPKPVQKNSAQNLSEALILACKKGDLEEVKTLIAQGADVNEKGMWGMTPLMWASSKGHWSIAKLLLIKGADVNAQANNLSTALMWTAFAGHEDIVKLLLAKGADVNAASVHGKTPLQSACYNGHFNIIRMLIKKKADLNAEDNYGKSSLAYATERGFGDIRALLLESGAKR